MAKLRNLHYTKSFVIRVAASWLPRYYFHHKYDEQNIGAERGFVGYISNGTYLRNLN